MATWLSESPTSSLIVSRWLNETRITSSPRRHSSNYSIRCPHHNRQWYACMVHVPGILWPSPSDHRAVNLGWVHKLTACGLTSYWLCACAVGKGGHYCRAGNFHQEKIFANFATCFHWQKIHPQSFSPVLIMMIWQPLFTALVKWNVIEKQLRLVRFFIYTIVHKWLYLNSCN